MNRCLYLIKNSLPIITSSVGLMVMNITDTLIIARLGSSALTALSLASIINMTFFMGLVAFVFPLGNLSHLDPKRYTDTLKMGLIILWALTTFITITNWFSSGYIARIFLSGESRILFENYFRWSSLLLIPGLTFFYMRVVLYTLERPFQITKFMLLAVALNFFGDLLIYFFFHNIDLVMSLIIVWTACLFSILVFLINRKLPKEKKLLSILKSDWTFNSIKTVCKACLPSMAISFFEYLFFCLVGLLLAERMSEQLALYRVVMQVEELLILLFYAISVVISLEVSKEINNGTLKYMSHDCIFYTMLCLLVSCILFLIYPHFLYLYGIPSATNINLIKISASILLISEALMLLSLSYLRGIVKNQYVLIIVSSVNWLIIAPIFLIIKANNMLDFIYLLIINFVCIALISGVIFKFKFYPEFQKTTIGN